MTYRHRNNDLLKTLKDYAVPLIGLVLILFLLFNVFSGNSSENTKDNKADINVENLAGVKISLAGENTKAFITYKNEKKVEITDDIVLEKGQTLNVEEGEISIVVPMSLKMKLSKAGELSYKEDGSFVLNSGNLWVEAMQNKKIFTKYAIVDLNLGAIVNISQNVVETAVYNIDGGVKVSSLYGIETKLDNGKKIIIKAKDTNSSEFDPKNAIKDIDDYFKMSEWFKGNGGDLVIQNKEESVKTSSGVIDNKKGGKLEKLTSLISFDNLQDESYSKESNIKVTGRYDTLKVSEITINNNKVKLDSINGNFSYNLNLNNKVNDLVVKVFDLNKNLLSKQVITIYLSSGNQTHKSVKTNMQTYKVNPSNFIIYQPSTTGKFTTIGGQVTIRGKVLDKTIKNVVVNDYTLKSFNGTTWRYHAFTNQGTLQNGANLYEIKYLDKDGKLVYKEYYNIYKTFKQTTKKKISGETKIEKGKKNS